MVDILCFAETLIVTEKKFRYILKTLNILPVPLLEYFGPPGKKSFLHPCVGIFLGLYAINLKCTQKKI